MTTSDDVHRQAHRELLRMARRFAHSDEELATWLRTRLRSRSLVGAPRGRRPSFGHPAGRRRASLVEGEAVRGTSPQIVFGLDEGGIDTAAESSLLAACSY